MDNKFYKVDLHVHTPASKCYKGDKSEDGYWQILRSAVKNGVRVIAITDHNTIEGYEKLIELKGKTIQEYEIIQKYDIPEQQKNDLQEKINLFDQVSIILGVEITLNPGVHIIVLCSDEAKDDLDSLLDEIGYSSDKRGGDTDIVPEIDIMNFLYDARLSGKIVLAPHIDSDNGIWNVLDGTYRATIFKSSIISAITCNNATQLEKIKELTRNNPLYKRSKPFVCVNASDAHEQSEIGKKHSYFKLSDFSFADLKKAFDSPEDSISDTEKQDFIDYVKKCAEYKPTIYINDIKELEASCYAILNNGDGCLLLGINENYQQHGIALTCKDMKETVKQIFDSIQANNSMRYAKVKFSTEQLGNGKSVGVILTESEESRLWINSANELYIYDDESGYKLATIREVEEITRSRILAELHDFEERNNYNIIDAIMKMRHVLNPISKYTLYDKIKAFSVPITYYFDIKPITEITKIDDVKRKIPENGLANGNVYYTSPMSPRLDNAYLRYSCPVYQNNSEEYISHLLEIKSPLIVITLGGGCHIIEAKEICYFECQTPSILLIPNEQFQKDNISLYHVIAWLKSDIFIWTCLQKNSDANIFYPNILLNCFVPYAKEYYDDTLIKEKIEEILLLEQNFLRNISTEIAEYDAEVFEDITDKMYKEHNYSVNRKATEIEKIIKKHIEINGDEGDIINDDLFDEGIYRYDEEDEMSGFEELEATFA